MTEETTRVQLDLKPETMQMLVELKERTEAVSYAEVVRKSIRLMHYASTSKMLRDGRMVVIL